MITLGDKGLGMLVKDILDGVHTLSAGDTVGGMKGERESKLIIILPLSMFPSCRRNI